MVKRILFISPTGTLDNGAEKSITNLMVYLSEIGYDIYNVYPENGHPTHASYESKLSNVNVHLFPLSTIKWWWEEAPGDRLFSKEERVIYYQKNIKEIRDIIVEQDIDLVISNTANVFQGAVAAACENIPHFWLIHEFPEREFQYYTKKMNFIFENSDKVFSERGNLAQTLAALNNNPANLETFIPYTQFTSEVLGKSNQRRIVSIGVINENKNQIELLKAYKKLSRYDIPLIFIGGWQKEAKKECDAFIEKYELTNVQFLGYNDQPWTEVTDSDICVYTSKSEAFPLVFIESILRGVPTIVSNNNGYKSVKEYFDVGTTYQLGNIDSLADEMADVLENFDINKSNAVLASERAKQLYTLDKCYDNLLAHLASLSTRTEKSLQAISSLLGETLPNHSILNIKKQRITIFYARADEEFSETNSLKFPLQYADELYFQIPHEAARLRIDLSEIPNYYKNVSLKTYHKQTELKVAFTNGLLLSNELLFGKNDPQLHYQIDDVEDSEFLFSYEMKDISDPMKEGSVLTELSEANEVNQKLLENITNLEERIHQLECNYQELVHEHNAVIGSRRWIIPTKIINFFRRRQ